MEGYIRKQLEKITGIPAGRIQFYTDSGLLIPEIDNPSGRGTTRVYSRKNLFELLIIRELANAGIQLNKIKAIFFHLKMMEGKYWDSETNTPIGIKFIIYNPYKDGCVTGWRPSGSEDVTVHMGDYTTAVILDFHTLAKSLP